ncbi:Putative N-acetylgalactosaminyl-diphosphoundecaprenol glucuronosyltransferase [Geitlerinema sp. FC II]|nr:Putative N-acetylgalactosaminyl-diphosphoundecaprenol glucuronosyltransferase [Geitlerinema sp. FC II]
MTSDRKTMSYPLVSVITPCYNGKSFIRRALVCVKTSTYPNIEHIVIDDASTDGSSAYLQQLQAEFKFTFVKSPKHIGAAAARNVAISISKGKYILPLDCDNYFDRDFIEKLVDTAESLSETTSPIYTPMVLFGDAQRTIEGKEWSLDLLLQAPFINICSLISRRSFDAVGGFDPRFPLLEDYDLFVSMALKGFTGKRVTNTRLYYNIRKDSVSDHFNQRGGDLKKKKIRQLIFQKHQAEFDRLGLRQHPAVVETLDNSSGLPSAPSDPSTPQPTPLSEAEGNVNEQLLYLVPGDAKTIVELGCDRGAFGVRYKRINPHCTYIGIDENAEAVEAAKSRLDRAVLVPYSQLDRLEIPPNSVDCVVFSANLANVVDAVRLLKLARSWLKDNGQLLASIPNPNHWQQILDRFAGNSINAFDVATIKKVFAAAHLHIFEMERCRDSSKEAQQLQTQLASILDVYQIDRAQFAKRSETAAYIVRSLKLTQPLKRLLVQTLMISTMASDRVRVYQPDRLLRTVPGVRPVSKMYNASLNIALPEEEKVFIWQRTRLHKDEAPPKQKRLIDHGYLIVVEIDDDPRFWPEHIEQDFITYRSCHCIQTSTEPLAEFLRQFNPYVKIFRNQLPEIPPPRQYADDGTVRLFFGALNREADWQPLIDVVNRVLTEFGDRVRVQVIHDKWFFNALQTSHKDFEPTCAYDRYHELLRACDVALLPLNPTEFNSMKSDLKFIECASHGVTVLASPTVYARSIVDGETGLLYNSLPEFETKLRRLLQDTPWRRQMANNAYRWVRDNRLLSQHYRERYDWYLEMRSRLPELNEALRQRVPEIFR